MTVQQEVTGFARRLRRLKWSLHKRLGPMKPIDVAFDTDQVIRVRPIDRFGRSLYLGGNSEPWLAELLDAYLEPGMTYFDIGAHIGQFVLMAAKRVGPTGRVHCFEAAAWTYEQLATNIKLNAHANINASHNAVFDESTTVELHTCVPGKEAFNSIGKPLRPDDETMSTEHVQTVVLGDYFRQHGVEKIDLIKIDVEGAEVAALSGARDMLSKPDAPPIICEVNEPALESLDESGGSLIALLRELGYGVYRFNPQKMSLTPEDPPRRYAQTVNLIACKDAQAFTDQLSRSK